jgi:hypothetical protein
MVAIHRFTSSTAIKVAGKDFPAGHLGMILGAMKNGQQPFSMKRPEPTFLRDTLNHVLMKISQNCFASLIEPGSGLCFGDRNASERLTRKGSI